MGRPRLVVPAVVTAAVMVLAACSPGSGGEPANRRAPDTVVVASFNFPESELLAEIYGQSLAAAGFPVTRSLGAGPRELVVPALVNGLVDLVPEYGGTALQFLSAGRTAGEPDSEATHAALRDALESLPLRALSPAPAQDANTFVVRRATAEEHGLERLSDLTAVARELVFGGPPECGSRPLCLPGLEEVYGIRFADVVSLDAGGPLTHQALAGGHIDVALLFTTDPALGGSELVELRDDRNLQPAENVTPLVRASVAEHWGDTFVARIDLTSFRLTTTALRELNRRVADGVDPATVAAQWLADAGLT